jgi:hypothetical protein
MKRVIILAIGTLLFTSSQATDKGKKQSNPVVVKVIPQGSNDGMKTYKVILSDGKVLEYMYMSEIREAKKTGVWVYNEMLEYNKSKNK